MSRKQVAGVQAMFCLGLLTLHSGSVADDAPMWKVEPRNLPYRDALKTAHLPGWPAPLSRAQSETIAKFVVIDMFAKACAGKSTKEVIADAQGQLKQIYKAA